MSSFAAVTQEPWNSTRCPSDPRIPVKKKKDSWFGTLDIHNWIPVFMCITIVILVVVVLIYFMDCPQEEWSPSTCNDSSTTELTNNDGIEQIEEVAQQEEQEQEESNGEEENETEQNTEEGTLSPRSTIHNDVSKEDQEQQDESLFEEGNHMQKRDVQPGEQEHYQEPHGLGDGSRTRKQRRDTNTTMTKNKNKHYNQRALQQQREMWRTQLKQTNRNSYQQQQQPIVAVHVPKQGSMEPTNTTKRLTTTVLLSDNNHEKLQQRRLQQLPKSKTPPAPTSMSREQGLIELEKWIKQEVESTYQKKDYSLDACERLWNRFKTQRALWQVNNQDLERIVTKTVKGHPRMSYMNMYKMKNVMMQYKKNKGF